MIEMPWVAMVLYYAKTISFVMFLEVIESEKGPFHFWDLRCIMDL